jgi:uncharacterized protein
MDGEPQDRAALITAYFGQAMAGEDVQVVRRVFDAFVRRDVDAAVEVMHPDVEFTAPRTQALVEKDVSYHGHDGVREYFGDVARVWEELEISLYEYHDLGGGRVLVVGRVRARGARHQLVDEPAQWAWRIEDDLIVWGRVFSDRAEAARSVGLVEETV